MIGYIDNYNDKLLFNKFSNLIKTRNAVIIFHKNITNIYKKEWVDKCIKSILDQKYVSFDIFELNYGNENMSLLSDNDFNNKHHFFVKDFENHIEAMNFLLHICFDIHNYDIVFNTNLDDYYDERRFILQILDMKFNKNILNSSLVTYIHDNGTEDVICNSNGMRNKMIYYDSNISWLSSKEITNKCLNNLIIDFEQIKYQLLNSNNIINHSGVCFSKEFWNSYDIYNNKLKYRNLIPFEDLELWLRTITVNKNKIGIVNRNLILYRIHNNQISNSNSVFELNIVSYTYSLLFNFRNSNLDYFERILDKIRKNKKKIKNIILFLVINPNDQYINEFSKYNLNKIIIIDDYTLSNFDIMSKYYFKFMLNSDKFIYVDYLKDDIEIFCTRDIYDKFELDLNYNKVN